MKRAVLNILDGFINGTKRLLFMNRSFNMEVPKRILICRLDHIGDVIMTTPVFRAIKEKYPMCELHVLTNSAGKIVLYGNPYVDGTITFNWPWPYDRTNNKFTFKHFGLLWQTIREIRAKKFDLLFELRGDIRMLISFGWFTGINRTVFYDRIGGGAFASKAIPHSPSIHELERAIVTMEAINIPVNQKRPELYFTTDEVIECFSKFYFIDGSRYFVVSPFAAKQVKEWDVNSWREVISFLRDTLNVKVLIVGSKENTKDSANIIDGMDEYVHDLCGKTSLREVGIILSKATLVIGVDTGTLHMTSSFDVPILVLFGPTKPEEFRPYSPYCKVIDSNTCRCDKNKHLSCDISNNGMAYCMKKITASMVCDEIQKLTLKYQLHAKDC